MQAVFHKENREQSSEWHLLVINWSVKLLKKKVGMERVNISHFHQASIHSFTYLQICDVFVDDEMEKENWKAWNLTHDWSKIILYSYLSFTNISNNSNTPPSSCQEVSVLIPATCEHVKFSSKRYFAEWTKWRVFSWGITQNNPGGFKCP